VISVSTPIAESTYLNRDMCKFESLQKAESRWQSTDSLEAYRNTSAFKCQSLRNRRLLTASSLFFFLFLPVLWKKSFFSCYVLMC